MKTEFLPLEEALSGAASSNADGTIRFPWAMVQTYSRLYLGVNPLADSRTNLEENELTENETDWKQFFRDEWKLSLLEARFFSDAEELRLFRLDGSLRAVLAAETDGDRWLEETCEIANKDKFGGSVTVRRVMDFDEDGQAYVAFTRLSGWEGAKQHE